MKTLGILLILLLAQAAPAQKLRHDNFKPEDVTKRVTSRLKRTFVRSTAPNITMSYVTISSKYFGATIKVLIIPADYRLVPNYMLMEKFVPLMYGEKLTSQQTTFLIAGPQGFSYYDQQLLFANMERRRKYFARRWKEHLFIWTYYR